ncbi:MAG: hypothetical protein WDZ83_15010 [Rhizobiaceae bacterium]
MLQFFFSAFRRGRAISKDAQDPSWRCDPLSHPAIERMTPTELADLPLGRVRYDCDQGS